VRGGKSLRREKVLARADVASVPDWQSLIAEAESTSTGQRLKQEYAEREKGEGKPHTDAKIRLFGAKESDVRITLYRDRAAWCPYCQKVWIMLEEKKIPYRINHINMRSYGPKPDEFLDKVPSGLLPAIELDGDLYTDSISIMQLLDDEFKDYGPRMVPPDQSKRIEELYQLERRLFGEWCRYMFEPGMPNLGFLTDGRKSSFEKLLTRVDSELKKSWDSKSNPWFLGGDSPSLIDLQFITHVERMEASCVYWKGMRIRKSKWPNIDRWFDAFEARESYRATKSDFYTHIMNIPPQYGGTYPDLDNPDVEESIAFIGGKSWNLPSPYLDDMGNQRRQPINRKNLQGESWTLPIPNYDEGSWEPITAPFKVTPEEARHEAAYEMVSNYENIVKFACRGNGDRGQVIYTAPLADPFAKADPGCKDDTDMLLRMAVTGLLRDQVPKFDASSIPEERRGELAKCVKYLRDRVGVPRDMSFPAAQHLRAYLHHLVEILTPTTKTAQASFAEAQ